MKPLAWYGPADADRRIAAAQGFVWLTGASRLVGVALLVVVTAFGTDLWSTVNERWIGVAVSLAMGVLYMLAGHLVGERRATGVILGIALCCYGLGMNLFHGRIFTMGNLWALAGIILVARAGHVTGFRLNPHYSSEDRA